MIYKLCLIIACAFAFCNAADYPDEKSDDDLCKESKEVIV